MIVTKTEPLTKTKYKVYLDGQFAFVLYKGELSRCHIKEGEEITEDDCEQILSGIIVKRAKKRAMHLLEDMDRTESALREKLKQGLYPQRAVDEAVAYVRSFGYLNDARYAENFVRSRMGSKSRREIHALLLQKGVKEDLISLAFEACAGEGGGESPEEEAIRRFIRRKKINLKTAEEPEIQRLYGYLARRGFRYDTVRQVIQNYDENA